MFIPYRKRSGLIRRLKCPKKASLFVCLKILLETFFLCHHLGYNFVLKFHLYIYNSMNNNLTSNNYLINYLMQNLREIINFICFWEVQSGLQKNGKFRSYWKFYQGQNYTCCSPKLMWNCMIYKPMCLKIQHYSTYEKPGKIYNWLFLKVYFEKTF